MSAFSLLAAWGLAAALTFIAGRPAIAALVRAGAVQAVRPDAPARHAEKSGTPTMGGFLVVVAALAAALAVAAGTGRVPGELLGWAAMVALFAVVGGLDDALGIRRRRNLGLRAREKLALQIPGALLLGTYVMARPHLGSVLTFPGTPWRVDLGWAYPLFCTLLVVGMANAVNLTDGLDGLAAGSVAITAGAFAVLIARAGMTSLGMAAAALAGAALGFLWYNAHPARVFMGDVGSQALGAALGVIGALAKMELLTLIIGGVFVAEAFSVILQVAYFKMTGGARLFRMSPIHHHFELSGWTETQTVVRFWIVGALLAALGVGLAS
jgi:phospho-N-acetylmuramoyl-pentapeptide-transferase